MAKSGLIVTSFLLLSIVAIGKMRLFVMQIRLSDNCSEICVVFLLLLRGNSKIRGVQILGKNCTKRFTIKKFFRFYMQVNISKSTFHTYQFYF